MTPHEMWLMDVETAIDNVVLAFLRLVAWTVMGTWLIWIILGLDDRK